ncbi:hypothetical protein BT69DRAFT_1278205 [Atractiella rhizophila]|nr:hypothetical protein BT69DRAFT_1278205 [Atractiella rhizophila]
MQKFESLKSIITVCPTSALRHLAVTPAAPALHLTSCRFYGTQKGNDSRRFPSGPPLEFFVLKAHFWSLYRNTIRDTRSLGNLQTRREAVDFIRHQFERFLSNPANMNGDPEKLRDFIAGQNRQAKASFFGTSNIPDDVKWRGMRRAKS